jgi:prolyl 4-hydroxylase
MLFQTGFFLCLVSALILCNFSVFAAEIKVDMTNTLDESVSIIWYAGMKYAFIMDIAPGETKFMNTYYGHSFYCVRTDDPDEKRFFDFEIEDHQDHIYIADDSMFSVDFGAAPPRRRDVAVGADGEIIDDDYDEGATDTEEWSGSDRSAEPSGILHPRVKSLNRRSTSVGAKFKSLYHKPLQIWYEDGRDGIDQGLLGPGKETTTNTYEGHVFYFTEKPMWGKKKGKEVARFTITTDPLYLIEGPESEREAIRKALPPGVAKLAEEERKFNEEYKQRTGIDWRHYYGPNGPRAPPVLHMHAADFIGQTHTVTSSEGHWSCNITGRTDCQSTKPVEMTLEVVSQAPRAFVIEHFLSDFEVDEIVKYAEPRIRASTVGNDDGGGVRSSDTRTSHNTWIKRQSSPIFETLFKRAAHLLKIDEALLHPEKNAEELQVVHYDVGQKYDAHHDWGVSGFPESRYITLLLYLNDPLHENAGGETSFPKGNNGLGMKVLPKKGSALLFYSLLEDGNGDDLSLHAAMPVHQGEKWLANFWVWDPKRK